mmetsp:Transcript_876/g.1061  ORF Transcript_876/g.1061 Transcript_876/m.1061 type:complete len:309 (-) Transcript_876:859-1785(-)|eukprot:CAMPEP_0184024284 /NCGR_PEP_ID=MMETSP0954-20121128/11978_1 /TAXON_ID=627963 /ORGANISM="Aplanochytrium sp, Strain PBS07" /LENGTH=308 /DNA_ID=CAMNT_0026307557 /DNA_START=166 /DNA_END=1092 /DNA_ORIENTATION=+
MGKAIQEELNLSKVQVNELSEDNEKLSISNMYRSLKGFCSFETFKESRKVKVSETEVSNIEKSEKRKAALVAEVKTCLDADKDVDRSSLHEMKDSIIIIALRVRHWHVDHAVQTLKGFAKFRHSQEWSLITRSNPSVLSTNMQYVLPYTDIQGRKAVVVRYGALNLKYGTVKDYQQMTQFCLERAMESSPEAQRNGVVMLLDFSGCGFSMLKQGTIGDAKRGLNMFRFFPFKCKMCYMINTNRLIRATIKSLSMLSTAAVRKKVVYVSSDYRELHDVFSPNGLTNDYGGKLGEEWKSSWFKQSNTKPV